MGSQSKITVTVALAANLAVAAAKLAGGLVTGSAVMLSESAHSMADTLNELFLLASFERGARPADPRHPFGYGMERFFWSLLAAVGIFVAGAGFSVVEAYRAFTGHEPLTRHYFSVNFVVLGVALLSEGWSWLRAIRQLRAEAQRAGQGMLERIRASTDPSVTTVASEDTAAVVGVVLAAGGLAMHQLTGAGWWEGVASALIAVLLVAVAIALGRDSKSLLIGEAATTELTDAVRAYLERSPAVDQVIDLQTMHIGVDRVLLAARVDLADDLDSAEIEQASTFIDEEIQRQWPVVAEVFLDATPAGRGHPPGR